MADLLDIVPTTSVQVVDIGGEPVTVHGLGIVPITTIVGRFPSMAGLLLGGLAVGDIGQSKFIQQFGQATGPIIAAGCGHLGDEKYEKHVDKFLLEDQLKLVMAIVKATCPNGFGFFAEMVKEINASAAAGEEAKPVKVRLKPSPSPSPPLSEEASPPIIQ